MVWRLWPKAKIFADAGQQDVIADYEQAIREGRNLLPGSGMSQYIAEEAYGRKEGPLLNPEQDVNNTEIDESYQPGR